MKKSLFLLLLIGLISCHRSNFSDERAQAEPTEEDISANYNAWGTNGAQGEEPETYRLETLDANGAVAIADSAVVKKKPAKTWKRSEKTANMATLFIGDEEQIPLKGSQIAVQVDGFRARVLIDCFFENDQNRQLEGTFKMKLPQGASPYYFAFGETVYVDKDKKEKELPFVKAENAVFTEETIEEMRSGYWSEPKVARVVAKEKAAFAYGNTVRKSIDPALAEWAGADVYNCRVFPLMPKKLHRIVIGYDVNLTQVDEDWVYQLDIPEQENPLIVDVQVAQIKNVLSVINPVQDVQMIQGKQAFRLTNPSEKKITIRYKEAKNIVLKSPLQEGKAPYFAAAISPQLPAAQQGNISDAAILALDVSLSSNPDKFNVWLKMAEAILTNNRSTIKRFNACMFNIESFWWEEGWVENTPAKVARFLAYANGLALEGASDLSHALASISQATWAQGPKNIFLLSDGADTWGESDSYAIANHISSGDRLFAYNSGMSGTNIQKLTQLTRSTGGALFAVTSETQVAEASTAFTTRPWKIEQISIPGTQDILIAGRPGYLFAGQNLMIAGRGSLPNTAKVKLSLSQEGVKKEIVIPLQAILESELTSRIYGQIATETLEEFDYATEKKSIAYARHFAVPGKTCSLLMLETEEDYQEYNITSTEDAYVVNSTQVSQIVADVLQEMKAMLASAKSQFTQWLNKVSRMNGAAFEIPVSMEMLVENTPEAAFRVEQMSLSSGSIAQKNLSSDFLEELKKPELDYDLINEEAEKRMQKRSSHDGLKALSSLIERNPGNTVLARDVAFTALDWGLDAQAYFLFKRVLSARPYEPQTYLAIAKTLSQIGKKELALLYYEIALQGSWQPRFGEFKRIATLDYIHFLSHVKDQNSFRHADYAQSRFQTLQGEMKETTADLMLVISWNTDNTDVDLHVIEPTGEECYYQHRETKIGGYLTQDVTQGYGPEMYILPDAKSGNYNVKVKYFSSDRNRATTRTKVYATIYQNWGKENESVKTQVVSLADKKEMHDIVTIEVD
jgi:tetratricopeptide (TPR) repeat protein